MRRYGIFHLNQLEYAISLTQIRKIVQNARTFLLPRLPRAVSAVLVDEGQLVPVLDLGLLSGQPSVTDEDLCAYQVLVESEYGTIALPAALNGAIVAETKGTLSDSTESKMSWIMNEFIYQNVRYKILDINFLAIEMTQNFWRNQLDTSAARRH